MAEGGSPNGAPPAKRLCIDLTDVEDSSLALQITNWLTVTNSEDAAEQFGDDPDTLRTVAKRMRDIAAAIDDRLRGEFADDLQTLVWLEKAPQVQYEGATHPTIKTVNADYLVGPNKEPFYISCVYESNEDTGVEQYSVECSLGVYENEEWNLDVDSAAQLLHASGITRFTDDSGFLTEAATYLWNPRADPDERLRVLKGFTGALLARVYDDIGSPDEYGMEIGWTPADVYDVLNDN